MGGILTDGKGKYFGVTCAHVVGSVVHVQQPAQIDRQGAVIGDVVQAQLPAPFPSHARKVKADQQKYAAKVDAALVEIRAGGTSPKLEVLKMGKVTDLVALDDIEQDEELQLTGWTSDWQKNSDPRVDRKTNLDGKENYIWLEATGRGHFVGVTMSVLQNQDGWWGEGDDMFFIDGEARPSIAGTGSEDYFLGAWDFGGHPFFYRLYGAPVVGEERAGGKSSVYRFHLDSPIPFTKSLRATIEHGHANHRSDNYYSVAYWYQTEPHATFPILPSVDLRIPRPQQVGGPGNSAVVHP